MPGPFSYDPSKFDLNAIAGMTEETRKAVAGAFSAMSKWRQETMAQSERNNTQMFAAMGSAAKAMGWPREIVDAMQQQVQGATRMQVQMVEQMMSAWETQLRSPSPMGSFPAEMMKQLQALPGFPGAMKFPGMEAFQSMAGGGAMNPMQFWMQMGEQWQKNWAEAMSMWAGGAKR